MNFFPVEITKKHKVFILSAIVIFWVVIGILIFVAEFIAYKYFGEKPLDAIEKRQYFFRWILWLILTPFIISFAFKLNFERTKILRLTLIHLLLGTFILTCEFFIEYGIIHSLAIKNYGTNISLGAFIVPYLHKYWAYISIYFLIIGIANVFLYIIKYRQSQQKFLETELQNKDLTNQLMLSQLQMLKMQIQPHFLFNTHQSIIGLIVKKENEQAKEMLLKLSNLLRLSLETQESEVVKLQEELQIIYLYLEIQQVRFKDRFTYKIEISDEAMHSYLPFLLLQPIVENAMIHGIEKLDENGLLLIEANVKNEQLIIKITDNGNSNLDTIKYRIGLTNIKNRLYQYYGEKAFFEIEKDNLNKTVVNLLIPQ